MNTTEDLSQVSACGDVPLIKYVYWQFTVQLMRFQGCFWANTVLAVYPLRHSIKSNEL